MLTLIRMWLEAAVVERDDEGGTQVSRPKQGTPQGGVISPLLANIYLHWFEKAFYRSDGPAHWANAKLVRYADDFVVLARYQSQRLIQWIESQLEGRFRLTINRKKTRVVNLRESGSSLDFLGFTLRYDRSRRGGGHYLNVIPSKKSLARIRERLRELTGPDRGWLPLPLLITDVNRTLQGWGQYFRHGYPAQAFHHVNRFAWERLECHLQRRSQRAYSPPAGKTFYAHLQVMGLRLLRRVRGALRMPHADDLGEAGCGKPARPA